MIPVIIIAITFVLLIPLPIFAEETVVELINNIDGFSSQLILVIVPIIGAFLTTKFVAQSWQDRRSKYELQQTILDKVDEAYTDYYLDLWNLVYDIGIKYFDESTYKYHEDLDIIKFDKIENFPNTPAQLPSNLFAEKFKKIYYDDLSKSHKNIEKLWTVILCYYGDKDEKLDTRTREIYVKADEYLVQFSKYFHSTERLDFEIGFYKLYEMSTDVIELTRKLKTELLQTKMKKRKL